MKCDRQTFCQSVSRKEAQCFSDPLAENVATVNKGVFEELDVLNRGYSRMPDTPSYLLFRMFYTPSYLSNKLITNCGSSSFRFTTDLKKFYRKKHSCGRSFCKLVVFKVSFKTIRGRSCNTDLRLHGARRNIFGSTTLTCCIFLYF